MSRAYVLMTAMPPTNGHLHLIQYAAHLADSAEVIVCTQPDEPYVFERIEAIRLATKSMNVNIHHIHKTLPQEPEGHEGFWDMWLDFLRMFGLQPGDYIVASETYGQTLADISGAVFMPYDIQRLIDPSKATFVRRSPMDYFSDILSEFQPNLVRTVTIFGAESTGKTTLSRTLSDRIPGHFLFEWARPYLETVGSEITTDRMTSIWKGQKALQEQGRDLRDKPFIFQDTDLFSTVGYWDMWDMGTPKDLIEDGIALKSDLYLITQSNIPFEPDPLRYGGDVRESPDSYWINLCENYGLNYVVLKSEGIANRMREAKDQILRFYEQDTASLNYTRLGREYALTPAR